MVPARPLSHLVLALLFFEMAGCRAKEHCKQQWKKPSESVFPVSLTAWDRTWTRKQVRATLESLGLTALIAHEPWSNTLGKSINAVTNIHQYHSVLWKRCRDWQATTPSDPSQGLFPAQLPPFLNLSTSSYLSDDPGSAEVRSRSSSQLSAAVRRWLCS